jgi:preprotein translocase subunit SecA
MSSTIAARIPWKLPAPELYPQRDEVPEGWFDLAETFVSGLPRRLMPGTYKFRLLPEVKAINERAAVLESMDDEDIGSEVRAVRRQLREKGLRRDGIVRSFALVRETARRAIGKRHYDVQLLGGLAMLHGMVAEMNTGEGKTLTATLAAATAAMAGTPVHVVTVNDYLVERDSELMAPIYQRLGLTVGRIVHDMKQEERRRAYGCNITYVTNKELAFDYLRDRIAIGQMTENLRMKLEALCQAESRSRRLVLRGLHFAIVDEADSVLIDEARTPLIISRETDASEEMQLAEIARRLAALLSPDIDYRVLTDKRQIELTASGKQALAAAGEELGGSWRSAVRREEVARQALTAEHLFKRDEHYIVVDGKIQIVDEYTGRIMADRSWNEGLHQLIEFKEGAQVTGRKHPVARISYQRFFRRYRKLAGMTGTAREVSGEMWSVYRLPVLSIPPNRPLRRSRLPDCIFPTQHAKRLAIAERARALSESGRPVLIGTRSVLASEQLSASLSDSGIDHVVLNARQDRDEAEIIAQAGKAGRVTVATNMAGRGVDIQLAPEAAAGGGLHVILSERHDAGRIDRQLEGRCARQGEPGSVEAMLSLEDPILEFAGRRIARWLRRLPPGFAHPIAARLLRYAQRSAERIHSTIRRELLQVDRKIGTLLAFSGGGE